MTGHIVLLVTSPRLPAGLLTAAAWDVVRSHPVLTAADSDQTAALRAAGVPVKIVEPRAAAVLVELADSETVVWLAGPTGDQDLARELGLRLAREPGLADLELMYGSWDPPGARLLDSVAVMDRLVSPGGDPWKRAQTHQSLAPYLLEEAYEAYDAIVAGDRVSVREELGDVLLQVILHARLAEDAGAGEEAGGGQFSIDDVAGDLVDKLIRRNPHVFGDTAVHSIDEITENWEQIKREEKARGSAMDGLALAQPALSLAAKVLSRVERAGITAPLPDADTPGRADTPDRPAVPDRPDRPDRPDTPDTADRAATVDRAEALGAALFALVAQARERGVDAEGALRSVVLRYVDEVRRAERGPRDP